MIDCRTDFAEPHRLVGEQQAVQDGGVPYVKNQIVDLFEMIESHCVTVPTPLPDDGAVLNPRVGYVTQAFTPAGTARSVKVFMPADGQPKRFSFRYAGNAGAIGYFSVICSDGSTIRSLFA